VTLADAIAKYVDFNQSMGMRFHVDEAMLKAFHRQWGTSILRGSRPMWSSPSSNRDGG